MEQSKIFITGGSGFIGTNLIEHLENKGCSIINFDKAKPLNKNQNKYWVKGNLLDIEAIREAIYQSRATIIIHLAARTDCDSNNISDYVDNTDGTTNLINCIRENNYIKHVLITSTQYVYKSKSNPFQLIETDYKPYTTYGCSKVITESIIRNANLGCAWTIIRPTNVWGPWHMRYPNELVKVIDKGLYIHPSYTPVIRTYAYVKNVVHQIVAIINAPMRQVDKKTFYLGDLPIDSYIWVNAFAKQLRGRRVKKVSSKLLIIPAIVGDIFKKIGVNAPIYSTRFKNMIEDYYAPTNVTIGEFGLSHPDLNENIKETVAWIKGEGSEFFCYWSQKKQ